MTAEAATIQVYYRFDRDYHVFTSQDVPGLYVSSKDAETAFNGVAPSLKTFLVHDYKLEPELVSVECIHTFSEFKEMITSGSEEPVPPALTDRSFAVKLKQAA